MRWLTPNRQYGVLPLEINGLNITIYPEQTTQKILGQNAVEGIVIKDNKTGALKQLDVSGVFVEIGLVPNSDMAKEMVKVVMAGNCTSMSP